VDNELLEILLTMNCPIIRIQTRDYEWMLRNLGINNRNHPQFNIAMELIKAERIKANPNATLQKEKVQ